jgi:hypothetical protein
LASAWNAVIKDTMILLVVVFLGISYNTSRGQRC